MTEPHDESPAARRQKLLDVAVWLGLILSTLAVYAQVADFDFVNYDDPKAVYQNPRVLAGLTPASVKWAFTAAIIGNWMPVTALSHLLDAQLFGMHSGMHHLTSVCFHVLASLFLYWTLRRATGARGLSAFVAFVFALHPLHVESVAWVAERKDVLSAFFWFLALYAYVRYTEQPGLSRYLAVVAPFCLGLLSKPMVVTFPFTLLLFDVWPLRRTKWPRTILEKLPLFALSAGAAVVTYLIQRSAGFVQTLPLAVRSANAFLSYAVYIRQTFWPARLAVFYPYPRSLSALWPAIVFSVVLVGFVSQFAIRTWRTRPYLAVGWFWYLGTLVPVIGLVQVGVQAHADRYMYIPMVGLLIMLAWGAADITARWPRTKPVAAVAGAMVCGACMVLAWINAAHWRNSEALFAHAVDAIPNNVLAEEQLGAHLVSMERDVEAIPHLESALRVKPDSVVAQANLGLALMHLDDCAAAAGHLQIALRLDPALPAALYALGRCRMIDQDYRGAVPYFEAAIRANPDLAADLASAHFQLADSLSKIPGRVPDAIREYEAALRLRPSGELLREAHVNLGMLLAGLGRTEEAIAHLEAAQQIDPDSATAKTLDRLRAGRK
jgi:Flp pilus assembly protein TadD